MVQKSKRSNWSWERGQRGRVQWLHMADCKCRKWIKTLLKLSWKASVCQEWIQYPSPGKIPESARCYFHDNALLRRKGNKWWYAIFRDFHSGLPHVEMITQKSKALHFRAGLWFFFFLWNVLYVAFNTFSSGSKVPWFIASKYW